MTDAHRRAALPWELIGGEAVILAGERLVHLDTSGTLLWQLLEQPARVDDLAAVIAKTTGAKAAAVRRDLDSALGQWHEQGLLA